MSAYTAELGDRKTQSITDRFSAFFEMTKPRIALMLVLTSAAGFYVGSITGFSVALFFNSMVGIALLAFGVAVLNQFLERDIDGLMQRTSGRPLPTGRVSASEALVFGLSLTIAAEAYLFLAVNVLTGFLGLAVIIGYVLMYTPLKRITPASTAIGAIPGAIPPLMGYAAASNQITIVSWFLFATLFLWQFPHFLAIAVMYRDQYRNAGIKMLPVVEADGRLTGNQITLFALMLMPVSIAPFFFGIAGVVFLIGAVILGLWFMFASFRMAMERSDIMARRLLFASVVYLPLYLVLLVVGC
ncbi:MAG: heme o synthase [Pyrinomonadaceae bacterium]